MRMRMPVCTCTISSDTKGNIKILSARHCSCDCVFAERVCVKLSVLFVYCFHSSLLLSEIKLNKKHDDKEKKDSSDLGT